MIRGDIAAGGRPSGNFSRVFLPLDMDWDVSKLTVKSCRVLKEKVEGAFWGGEAALLLIQDSWASADQLHALG